MLIALFQAFLATLTSLSLDKNAQTNSNMTTAGTQGTKICKKSDHRRKVWLNKKKSVLNLQDQNNSLLHC